MDSIIGIEKKGENCASFDSIIGDASSANH
jgi:hypothetical protein